uniref:Uncharacterized protein n=1 Tax=Gopherus agassizii TaxID=38772 RepID=A0A452HBL4_9SAUR
ETRAGGDRRWEQLPSNPESHSSQAPHETGSSEALGSREAAWSGKEIRQALIEVFWQNQSIAAEHFKIGVF